MRDPGPILFFAIAAAGLAYVAWRGAGPQPDENGGGSLIQSILIVGGVFIAVHAVRHLLMRRFPPRDDEE